ncbi:MAG: hypothetical protein MJZ64_01305 [Paludibacteraceae bacterium]|nr:hypothetical protein [Paludibacteraceae bacterium]
MNNWFQTSQAETLFDHSIRVEQEECSCLAHVQGCSWTKRAIVQGGPYIKDEFKLSNGAVITMMQQMRNEAIQQHCIYAEMRCYDDYSSYRLSFEQAGWVYQPHYDVLIYPMRDIPEAKMRQINNAIRIGYSWHEAKNAEEVNAFYKCLKYLYRTKVHRPLPKESFFLSAWQQGVKVLVTVNRKGEIIGGVLMPVMEEKAYEWYICGQVMSTWSMIEYSRLHNIQCIDMMGAGEPGIPYGVRDFKLQMGGELKEWGRYICILKPWIYQLGKKVITKI